MVTSEKITRCQDEERFHGGPKGRIKFQEMEMESLLDHCFSTRFENLLIAAQWVKTRISFLSDQEVFRVAKIKDCFMKLVSYVR